MTKREFKKPKERVSRLYYLLPILFGAVGGVIGYFLVKKKNKEIAEKLLIIGLIWLVIPLTVILILWFIILLLAILYG